MWEILFFIFIVYYYNNYYYNYYYFYYNCCYYYDKRFFTLLLILLQLKMAEVIISKRREIWRYEDSMKQFNENWNFQNYNGKFYIQLRGECMRIYQQSDTNKLFSSKIREWKNIRKKIKSINNKEKEWQNLEEGSEVEIHLEFLWENLKNVPNWNTPDPDKRILV